MNFNLCMAYSINSVILCLDHSDQSWDMKSLMDLTIMVRSDTAVYRILLKFLLDKKC